MVHTEQKLFMLHWACNVFFSQSSNPLLHNNIGFSNGSYCCRLRSCLFHRALVLLRHLLSLTFYSRLIWYNTTTINLQRNLDKVNTSKIKKKVHFKQDLCLTIVEHKKGQQERVDMKKCKFIGLLNRADFTMKEFPLKVLTVSGFQVVNGNARSNPVLTVDLIKAHLLASSNIRHCIIRVLAGEYIILDKSSLGFQINTARNRLDVDPRSTFLDVDLDLDLDQV